LKDFVRRLHSSWRQYLPGPAANVALLGFAFCVAYAAVLYAPVGADVLRFQTDFVFLAGPIFAFAFAFQAVRRASPGLRTGWIGFTVLLASWFLADLSYTVYDLWQGAEPPVPGPTDVLYYFGYAGLLVGVAYVSLPFARIRDGRWLLDALAVSLVAGVIVGQYLIGPILAQDSASSLATAVLLGYPLLDLAVFAMLAVAFFATGSGRPKRTLPLLLAALVLIGTDLVYFDLVSVGSYESIGNPTDIGYLASYVLFAVAFALPEQRPVNVQSRRVRFLTAALPAVAGLVMLAILAVESLRGTNSLFLQLGSMAVLGVLLARYALSVRRYESEFDAITRGAGDLVAILEPDSTVVFQNAASLDLLGLPAGEVIGTRFANLVHPEYRVLFQSLLMKARAEGATGLPVDLELVHADGRLRTFEVAARDETRNPSLGGIALVAREVTRQRQLAQELRHQATIDGLTGLLNVQAFHQRVQQHLDAGDESAVLYLDIDNFKALNDSLGHPVGDLVLKEVASRLTAAVRSGDCVGRLGGDEFAVFFQRAPMVEERAREIMRRFEVPLSLGETPLSIRVSAGIAKADRRDISAAELIANADAAMFEAKRRGKNRVEVFEKHMLEVFSRRLKLLNDLHDAVKHEQLVVYYQPISSLATGKVLSVEALLLWQHPKFGLIPPDEFIGIAEDSGLIIQIGAWVLGQACNEINRLLDVTGGNAPSVSVNVSAKQFADGDFAEIVKDILDRTGAPPELLVLEITESAMVQDISTMVGALSALREVGVRTAIDDFGTGYSSLGQLRDLPFEILKADRTFIQNLALPSGRELANTILEVGRSLNMEVVAEGIETAEQLEQLLAMGYETGQGFHFARPAPAEQMHDFLIGKEEAA